MEGTFHPVSRAAAAVALFVCVAFATGLASAQSLAPIPIRLGIQPQGSWLLYTAKENQFFEKAGLAPTWIKFTTGPQSIAAMQSRSVDITTPGTTPFIAGIAQGVNWIAVGIDNEQPTSQGFAARKGTSINKLEDLKGKTVGAPRGTTAYYGLLTALKRKGIKETDVKILTLAPPDQIGAMTNGDVDAVAVWEPFLGRLIRDHGARLIGMEADYGVYTALAVVAVHGDFLKENPEAVRRYLRALLMAHEHIQKNGPGAALDSMAGLMGISKEHAEQIYKLSREPNIRRWNDPDYLYSVAKGGKLSKNAQEMADFLLEQKMITKPVDVNAAFDASPITSVLNEKSK